MTAKIVGYAVIGLVVALCLYVIIRCVYEDIKYKRWP